MFTDGHEGENRLRDSKEALIRQVGDSITLVGVNHRVAIESLPHPQTHFKTSIQNAEHLILESPRINYEEALEAVKAGERPQSYESYALANFLERGKSAEVHCLEEGRDLFALADRYNLSYRDLALSLLVPVISNAVEDAGDDQKYLAEVLKEFTGEVRDQYPALAHLPEGELEGWIGGLSDVLQYSSPITPGGRQITLRELPQLLKTRKLFSATGVIQQYMGQIREYELICPRAKSFADDLPGKKVILVGRAHMPVVEQALKGEKIAKPPPWPEYVRSLKRRDRKDIAAFDTVAPKSFTNSESL